MKKRIEIQLVKFGLVGLLNTAIDLGVFTLLTAAVRLDSVISHVISYSCGVINSYYWNRTWTFQKKGKFHPAEFLKFVLVNLVSLGASAWYYIIWKPGQDACIPVQAGCRILFSAGEFCGKQAHRFQRPIMPGSLDNGIYFMKLKEKEGFS